MSDLLVNAAERRPVLRVLHDVDAQGHVVDVQLEVCASATQADVAWAAWQAARRRHPWIIGDGAVEQLELAQRIAFSQVNHLMNAVDEALALMIGLEHAAVHRLREAAIDLRGYMPALRGELRSINQTITRRAG